MFSEWPIVLVYNNSYLPVSELARKGLNVKVKGFIVRELRDGA